MVCVVLLAKYGVQHLSLTSGALLHGLLDRVRGLEERAIMLVLGEIFSTSGDLRARVNPKYRFDERLHDLSQCLLLDGYIVDGKKLLQVDPSISDAEPLEDDLIRALRSSKASRREEIVTKINDSTSAFRATPPDYNAALVNARVALETLAREIARDVSARLQHPVYFDPSKWGDVVAFLRNTNEISLQEEKGLVGVFGFLSPGAHRPVGLPEDQMTRLGRSFALNMCWFLLKNHQAKLRSAH